MRRAEFVALLKIEAMKPLRLRLAEILFKRPGHIFSQNELIEAVWADDGEPEDAAGSLRHLVMTLRADDWPIVSHYGRYSYEPGGRT